MLQEFHHEITALVGSSPNPPRFSLSNGSQIIKLEALCFIGR